MLNSNSIGLRGVGAELAPRSMNLDELAAAGRLPLGASQLAQLGFSVSHVVQDSDELHALALSAARQAIADAELKPENIDLLIWAGALPSSHVRHAASPNPLNDFRYTAGWTQEELSLHNATFMAVAQQGCSTMFSALRAARWAIHSEPRIGNVLCVGADALPSDSPRQILHTVISDAACAAVVSRDCPRDRFLADHQFSCGHYWDVPASQTEIIAAYFPTSRRVIDDLLSSAHLSPTDIDLVVPTGVGRQSWEILLRLTGIPIDRLFQPARAFGHTILADNFLHLKEIRQSGRVKAGARLLLFTYGFGSTWSGILLEH